MNLGMDARSLFSNGFHPVSTSLTPDLGDSAHGIPRFASPESLKYYFIDFGISVRIPAGQPRSVLGIHGLDCDVPELSLEIPYNPFKVDIWGLGVLVLRAWKVCDSRLSRAGTRAKHLASSMGQISQNWCRSLT